MNSKFSNYTVLFLVHSVVLPGWTEVAIKIHFTGNRNGLKKWPQRLRWAPSSRTRERSVINTIQPPRFPQQCQMAVAFPGKSRSAGESPDKRASPSTNQRAFLSPATDRRLFKQKFWNGERHVLGGRIKWPVVGRPRETPTGSTGPYRLLVSGWPFSVVRAPAVPLQPWCCRGRREDVVAPLPLRDVSFRPASTVVGDLAVLALVRTGDDSVPL